MSDRAAKHAARDAKVMENDEAIIAHELAIGIPRSEVTPKQRRAFRAGYAAGAEAMRERAAKACHDAVEAHGLHSNFICAKAIRALPLTEDK